MNLRVSVQNGMVNIDSDHLAYANIQNMYEAGHGTGIQVDPQINNSDAVSETCNQIAELIYKLQKQLASDSKKPA
ncbi:hypothetical protein [Neptuniibacter sp. QD37_11]|uniref:hypothetical protein n=1 Tax=Neptuniibacter sp. QD37_11 TaxID=3398209 RepID=UPI0039F5E356